MQFILTSRPEETILSPYSLPFSFVLVYSSIFLVFSFHFGHFHLGAPLHHFKTGMSYANVKFVKVFL